MVSELKSDLFRATFQQRSNAQLIGNVCRAASFKPSLHSNSGPEIRWFISLMQRMAANGKHTFPKCYFQNVLIGPKLKYSLNSLLLRYMQNLIKTWGLFLRQKW